MPTWTQQQVGGGWNATFEDVCNIDEQTRILDTFNNIVNNPRLNILDRLVTDLRALWDVTEIDCGPVDGFPPNAVVPINETANKLVIRVTGTQNPFFQVNLLRLLVSRLSTATNGSQLLDVEAAEFACFQNNGATLPSQAQFLTMGNGGTGGFIAGEYCFWDQASGEIFDKDVTNSGWGGPSITTGPLCFQNNNWIF